MDHAEEVAREEDMRDEQRTATKARAPAFDFDLEPKAAQLPAPITAQQLQAPAVTPDDLLRIAVASGDKDIERLERLMQMQIRYREMQEQDRKLAQMLAFREDFALFKGENIIIPKSKHVDRGRAGSFDQAEYDLVCGMLAPALSRRGFGFRHDPKFTSRRWITDGVENDIPWVIVVTYLEHRKGHFEIVTLEGPPGDLQANTPAQNMQATASFMKRQGLLAITGTATGGEDDESRMVKRTHGAEKSDELDGVRKAGQAAALEGLTKLTAWWGALTDKQRADLSKDFGVMRKTARAADDEARK